MTILRQHYEGIIGEIFRRGAGGVPLTASDTTRFCGGVFLLFPGQIVTLTDCSAFCTTLWRLVDDRVNAQFGLQACKAAEPLKPKFMLRQFVDDLPSGEPRGVLRAFAYDHGPDPGDAIVIERRALLRRAYPQLHAVLWRNREDLDHRTGGAITVRNRLPGDADLAQYERWLFLS